jgi:hypothetical protein
MSSKEIQFWPFRVANWEYCGLTHTQSTNPTTKTPCFTFLCGFAVENGNVHLTGQGKIPLETLAVRSEKLALISGGSNVPAYSLFGCGVLRDVNLCSCSCFSSYDYKNALKKRQGYKKHKQMWKINNNLMNMQLYAQTNCTYKHHWPYRTSQSAIKRLKTEKQSALYKQSVRTAL